MEKNYGKLKAKLTNIRKNTRKEAIRKLPNVTEFNLFDTELHKERGRVINYTQGKNRLKFFSKEFSFFNDPENVFFKKSEKMVRVSV